MAKDQSIDRDQAFSAKPVAVDVLEREVQENGTTQLTVNHQTGKWQRRLLRLPAHIPRTFELDAVGIHIFDQCDGNKTVRHIIKKFAKENDLDQHEAEKAVTAFMRMMMQRGLITMRVPKK